MDANTLLPEKIFQYLIHLFDTSVTYDAHEFLIHSSIHREKDYSSPFSDAYRLFIIVNPEIFKKYQGQIKQFENTISSKIYQFTHSHISKVSTVPDLRNFQILENRIVPINTPWEDINAGQKHLLNLQRMAKEIIDFQNIGNSCRTLLQKLANIIFKPTKHISEDKSIDLSESKFKNRLHTYIRVELAGSNNKELRDYALSVITTAEKSVDLANKLTHDLNATPFMAESCVISTVTVINIVKLIEKKA
jgi:hypothetical protein